MNVAERPSREGAQLFIWALLWTGATRYGGKLVNLLTTIVLAWLLTKEDFGLAGYALVFVTFIEIFEGFGVESALVYHDEDRALQNNAFWISALTGLGITTLVFFGAPVAAWVFDDPRAIPLVELLSLAFLFTGLRVVPKALLMRRMEFKRLAVPEFVKVIIKGVAAISLAFSGFGPWSLIASVVIALAAELVALWWMAGWRPDFRVTWRRDKFTPLLGYGGGLMGLNVLGTLTLNIDYVLVGRLLGTSALGVYMLGFRLPTLLLKPVISSLSKVLFPASVRQQGDRVALLEGWRQSVRFLSMISIPVGVGIASVAPLLVPVLFGQKWIDAVPVVAAIALQTVLISLAWNTGDIYKALGRIRLLLWLGAFQLAVTAPLLFAAVTMAGTVAAVAWAHVAAAAIATTGRLWIMSRVMDFPATDIVRLLWQPVLAGILMGLAVLGADALFATVIDSLTLRLICATSIGIGVYAVLAMAFMGDDLRLAVRQLRALR